MIVVSNTSPLTSLAIIGKLDLLRLLYGRVHIPPAVREELGQGPEWPGQSAVREARWIVTHRVADPALVAVLEAELHSGEAEAVALANELHCDLVLLDEAETRRVAERLGLKQTGAVGVLLEAKRRGLVQAVRPVLDDLQREAGFWLSDDLYLHALELAGEQGTEAGKAR